MILAVAIYFIIGAVYAIVEDVNDAFMAFRTDRERCHDAVIKFLFGAPVIATILTGKALLAASRATRRIVDAFQGGQDSKR